MTQRRAVKVTLLVEYEDGSRSEQGFFHLGGEAFGFQIEQHPDSVNAQSDGVTVQLPRWADSSPGETRSASSPA